MYRTEEDSLGKVKIPKDAHYGTTTARALKNFQISKIRCSCVFMESLGIVKLAAAQSNHNLKLLTAKQFKAIKKACETFISGKYRDEFSLDVFQAGAGTSYNMNANEIIATLAKVHPNDHVNMGQSTNDVIPTATRIATLFMLPALLSELQQLENTFTSKAKEFSKITKVGRTHLQDAVPISLGQEFDAYAQALRKSREFIERESSELQILGIGGTAVGTGITAHPRYRAQMIKNLSSLTGIKFTSAKNLTEIANNMNSFMNFSAGLRSLATNFLNISQDLKLLSSGPKAGFNEITLPAVQPGSSIMPGKINPSIPECVEMIALQVLGNDTTISAACSRSTLELNTNCPIIMYNLLQSMKILANGAKTLRTLCVKGIKANKKEIADTFEQSLCTATELAPKLGYAETADIVKTALKKGITIKEELKARGLK